MEWKTKQRINEPEAKTMEIIQSEREGVDERQRESFRYLQICRTVTKDLTFGTSVSHHWDTEKV